MQFANKHKNNKNVLDGRVMKLIWSEVTPLMSCSYSEKDISTTSLSTIAFLGCFTFIIKKIRNIEFQQKHFGINLRRTMVSYRIRIYEVYPENLRRLSDKNVTFSPDGTVVSGPEVAFWIVLSHFTYVYIHPFLLQAVCIFWSLALISTNWHS